MKVIFLLLLAQLSVSSLAYAQDEAPQEAPYVQDENEFDVFSNEGAMSEEADAAGIENEISKPGEAKDAVNLNEASDKKIEDELILEEDNKVAIPTEDEPAPYQEPVIEEVKPAQKIRRSGKTTKSAKGGVEYIKHPQAEKGLVLITKEGAYVYKTDEGQGYKQSGAFRFGTMDAPKITAADGTTTFAQMYSGNQLPVISFDFDWQPFQGFGKLGLQSGFSLMFASGNGRFANDGQQAEEKYTFIAVPLNLGLTYRLEVWDRQWLAPYVSAGGTYIGVVEMRDDGKSPAMVGTPGAYGGAGLMFNISAVSRDTRYTLRTEYGIQNLWVSADFKYLKTFSEDLDFSSAIVGGGLVLDY